LQRVLGVVERSDSRTQVVSLMGGVVVKPEVRLLNRGFVDPLRGIVLGARPRSDSLVWHVPLDGWDMPNSARLNDRGEGGGPAESDARPAQCAIQGGIVELAPKGAPEGRGRPPFPGLAGPVQAPPTPLELKGVSLKLDVSEDSLKRDATGELGKTRKQILESRPSDKALTWPKKESR
jgi:hypothetical protein